MDPRTEKLFAGLLPFLNPNLTDEQIALVVERIDAALEESREAGWEGHENAVYLNFEVP